MHGKETIDEIVYNNNRSIKEIYCNREYNNLTFSIIEKYLPKVDRKNGRPGMNLWTIFVLGQVRMSLGLSYDMLHHLSNNDLLLRKLLGFSEVFGGESFEFAYQIKTDSFVVESNVHFPTDYNLLWDCARKSLDAVNFFVRNCRKRRNPIFPKVGCC